MASRLAVLKYYRDAATEHGHNAANHATLARQAVIRAVVNQERFLDALQLDG
jgi:hypothetical protein